MAKSPILGGFSTARSPDLAASDSYNLFVEIVETKDGVAPGALYNAPGLDRIVTLGPGPIRGMRDLQDILYVVSGGSVYSLTPNGIATLVGSIGLGSTPVSMFENGQQLMIVDGVGGWLVPGGYPLASGTIGAAGGLYAIGDTITLEPATVTANAFPVLTVTAISEAPVVTFVLGNPGTAYNTATGVATAAINAQAGGGSGLTVDITAAGGPVTAVSLATGGTGYNVGDTGIIAIGSQDAVYRVNAVSGGVVTAIILLNPGSRYSPFSGAATAHAAGVSVNVGTGLTVNLTATGGPIGASSVANGGRGYAIGNAGFISGGTADATYLVTAVGRHGNVTAFSITEPGATAEPALQYTQRSTSGSGGGFTLAGPTYGAFVGLVPVTLPFPKPVMGDSSDGFGLLVFEGRQVIAQSDNLDLSTWQPLNFGVASQASDNCMALKAIHNEVFVLKQRNTEIWADAGLPGFSFAPLSPTHMEWGIWARFSLAKAGDTLLWLSRNDQGQYIVVQTVSAYQAKPISTQALIAEFETYPNVGDAIGYCFQQGQHTFYVLVLPEADKTWCYDLTSSELAGVPVWHRLASWDASGGTQGVWHRHWGNAFWPWNGTGAEIVTVPEYQAQSVTQSGVLATASGLVGLPTSFSCALFSVWLNIPDGSRSGVIFSNQTDVTLGSTNPGLFISIQNDARGSPQITLKAWDADNAAIVTATYAFANWADWVNVLVSIDTATQVLQVYANTVVNNSLVETALTPASITWTSSNAIAAGADQPWHVTVPA